MKQQAKENGRSRNAEVIAILEEALARQLDAVHIQHVDIDVQDVMAVEPLERENLFCFRTHQV